MDGVDAWGMAKVVEDAGLCDKSCRWKERHAGGNLLDGGGNAAEGRDQLRRDGGELHDDVARDDGCGCAVEVLAYAGDVGRGCGEKDESACRGAANLIGAVELGVGEGYDLLAVDELDARIAERNAVGSGDGAANDDGLGRNGEERRGDEGEDALRRPAVVRVQHNFDCRGRGRGELQGMRRSLPVVLRDSRSRWAWAASASG